MPHSPPCIPLRGYWRLAAAAAQGSVSAEADGKCTCGCCLVTGNALAAPICSWEASHVTHDMRPSLKYEQWLQASCSEELRALNAATKKRNTWDQTKVLDLPGHASLLPLSIDSLEQREIVLTQEIILTLFGYWLFFLFLMKYSWFTILCWLLLYSNVIHLYILFFYSFPLWFLTGYYV